MTTIQNFLLAASQRDDTKVISYLQQYGTPLAQASGNLQHKLGSIEYTLFGNALHHTISGRLVEIEQLMDDKIFRIVAELIKYKCDVNGQATINQFTPLHSLCEDTDPQVELVKYTLIHPHMDVEEAVRSIAEKIAANQAPKLKIAEMLLQAGAKASIPDIGNKLPIDWIGDPEFKAKMDALFKKYQPRYLEEGKILIEKVMQMKVMLLAIHLNDTQAIRDSGADPNAAFSGNAPPLAEALLVGKPEAFFTLLEMGADPMVKFPIQEGVEIDIFEYLAKEFNAQIFRKCLELKFDPNRITVENNCLAHFSKVLWHHYALLGNVRAIEILIARKLPLEMDTKIEGRTILDLLKNNFFHNHPFIIQKMREFEENNRSEFITYELVKIIDKNPQFLNPMDQMANELQNRGVDDLPEVIKGRFQDNLAEIAMLYFSLVSAKEYKIISGQIKDTFRDYEWMKSTNHQQEQIIELLERYNARPRRVNNIWNALYRYCTLI